MESTQSLQRKASQSTLSVQTEPKHEPASTATPLLESSDATLAPQGWPTSPSRIKHPLFPALLDGAFDIALFAFSSCFLVFSLVVMSYDGAPTSENPRATTALTRATKYGPTVFPLLFASVVGRATHAILVWRLEKGERIQILDMLATSTSLTSTVISQIQLRQVSVLSVLLVAIWVLSPIAGQASLRQMSIETSAIPGHSSFQYVAPIETFVGGGLYGFPNLNNLFITAMYAASNSKASPVDLWGNIKIPRIEQYEETATPDNDGWFTTRMSDDGSAAYVSFVGIPFSGTQDKNTSTDYDFRLQTEYLNLTCASAVYTEKGMGSGEANEVGLTPKAINITGGGNEVIMQYLRDHVAGRNTAALETLTPFNFSYIGRTDNVVRNNLCSVKTSYVEVEISCAVNSTCRAVKVRRSQLPQLPSAFTFLDRDEIAYLGPFLTAFTQSLSGDFARYGSSTLQAYIMDPSLRTIQATQSDQEDAKMIHMSDEILSERFGQLLNSYWTCTWSTFTLTDGIDANTSYFWDTNITFKPPKSDSKTPYLGDSVYGPCAEGCVSSYNWTDDGTFKSRVWSSQGNTYEHVKVIKANTPWAITLAVVSLLLIIFSLFPPLVRHFLTNGPDIAMNFSSLATRNNTHVPIPAGGSFLPASDRFRLLKDLRLRFADAEGKSDVGTLVIAAQGVEKTEYSRVRKGRLYE